VNLFALERVRKALSTPRTRRELLFLTGLPDRTLRYYLAKLRREGVLIEKRDLLDARRKIFVLKTP